MREARALLLGVRRICRGHKHHGKHVVILVDSLAVALAVDKGRSSTPGISVVVRRIASLVLAAGIYLHVRWLPSELNSADSPSRGL